jgi:hypothetical protein
VEPKRRRNDKELGAEPHGTESEHNATSHKNVAQEAKMVEHNVGHFDFPSASAAPTSLQP